MVGFFELLAVISLLNVITCSTPVHLKCYINDYCHINCASLALTDHNSHFNEVG